MFIHLTFNDLTKYTLLYTHTRCIKFLTWYICVYKGTCYRFCLQLQIESYILNHDYVWTIIYTCICLCTCMSIYVHPAIIRYIHVHSSCSVVWMRFSIILSKHFSNEPRSTYTIMFQIVITFMHLHASPYLTCDIIPMGTSHNIPVQVRMYMYVHVALSIPRRPC